MITSHRYLILSNQMRDLSEFEDGTNWGLHTAVSNSKFKVLDIYTVGDKSQILLLHLIIAFEEVFKNSNDFEKKVIESARENFDENLNKSPIEELTTDIWIGHCKFPIGMSYEGKFF